MAACGGLQQIFESPFKPLQSDHNDSRHHHHHHHSFTDLLENPSLNHHNLKEYKHNDAASSFCSLNSESLQMCTEGLGFESLDDVEDLKNHVSNCGMDTSTMMSMSNAPVIIRDHSASFIGSEQCYMREKKSCIRSFPPPISSLTGKPSVCFKSYREDGRFVLQEVRIPKHEYLHASREDGRLRLSFVQSDEDDDDDDVVIETIDEDGDEIREEDDDG